MIEEPLKLTIKRPSHRPTAEQIKAFQQVSTGFVVDAMDGSGALHPTIKPIGDNQNHTYFAAGPALTVDTGPADVLALFAALSFIQAGDIVVSAFSGYQGCAALGDRVAGMIKNNRAGGMEVETGDMIVADLDGVVVVPFENLDAVIERLETIKQLETELDQAVVDGLTQLESIAELLESDQVRYVD